MISISSLVSCLRKKGEEKERCLNVSWLHLQMTAFNYCHVREYIISLWGTAKPDTQKKTAYDDIKQLINGKFHKVFIYVKWNLLLGESKGLISRRQHENLHK